MKNYFLLLLIIVKFNAVSGQESTKIIFSQENDTLVKQRFIDRYENIFMTQVPGRHMFKIDGAVVPGNTLEFSISPAKNIAYALGYEYKISSSFSAGINVAVNNAVSFHRNFKGTLSANIQARWYYDMQRRIRDGRSANNFSGNYFAIILEKQRRYDAQSYPLSKEGLEFGIQRRFLNRGRIDFAVGIFHQKYMDAYFTDDLFVEHKNVTDIVISTRVNAGLAFGDWKRSKQPPLCEILYCDEFVNQQWKMLWPNINLGTRMVQGSLSLAYERKFGKSPVSVNAQVFADYRNRGSNQAVVNFNTIFQRAYQIQPSLQIRYYFLQSKQIKRGLGGNNLSGLYAGPYSDYIKYKSLTSLSDSTRKHLGAGFIIGYQKTLFRNIYFDLYASESWNLLKNNADKGARIGAIRAGFGLIL